MNKTVKVPDYITADQFGVDKQIFERDIKGKELPLVGARGSYVYVLAGADEVPYSIHIDDLKPKTVADAG